MRVTVVGVGKVDVTVPEPSVYMRVRMGLAGGLGSVVGVLVMLVMYVAMLVD